MRTHESIAVDAGVGPGCPAACARADLKAALAEHDLGRRSKLALDNAGAAMKAAREAYQQAITKAVAAAAKEIQESVDLAWDSLERPERIRASSPKWFKQAEIETRNLLKKLETLQHDMGFEDRPMLDKCQGPPAEGA